MHQVCAWLRAFVPEPTSASRRERVLGALGAGLGLLSAAWISRLILGVASPWFIAPMGASAVLLFAVPSSPLAQPWSIAGGNTIAALIGITCASWMGLGEPALAAGVAGALAIGAMFPLRCLHPPGGAVALTAVLGGPEITGLGYGFVWAVVVNSGLLLLAALIFNNLARRRYPHRAVAAPNPHHTADPLPSERVGFTRADLDAALEARGEVLDVSKDDLREILTDAELRAQRRRFGETRCGDIMAWDVVRVDPDALIGDAWRLLERHKVKALPVTTDDRKLVGIVSMHDFFIARGTLQPLPFPTLDRNTTVAEIMTAKVRTARPDQSIVDLVELFSDGGLHHLPVVDEEHRVIGMVTQSDLVAALFKSGFRQPSRSRERTSVAA